MGARIQVPKTNLIIFAAMINMIGKYPAFKILLLLSIAACEEGRDYQERDLLSYGVPLKIQVPADTVTIEQMDWGLQKDITLSGPDNYEMQIFHSDADTRDVKELRDRQKESVKEMPYFDEVLLEEEDGFIFRIVIDSLISHDFRHVKIEGSNQYIFQAGMYGSYSREEIDELYRIAKEAE